MTQGFMMFLIVFYRVILTNKKIKFVKLGNEIKNKEQKIKEILNKEIESKLELKNDSCEPVKTRSQKKI